MNPLLFCAYAPGKREVERSVAWQSIKDTARTLPSCLLPCYGEKDYSIGLMSVWQHPGDLIVVEHDVYVEPRMVKELDDCPHPACAWATWASAVATGLQKTVVGIRMRHLDGFGHDANILDGWGEMTPDGYSDTSSICLVKLPPNVRKAHPVHPDTWMDGPCYQLNEMVRPKGWHIHFPPTAHFHGFTRRDNDRILRDLTCALDEREYRPDAIYAGATISSGELRAISTR